MPDMDGTGPLGQGPLTGQGLGECQTQDDTTTVPTEPETTVAPETMPEEAPVETTPEPEAPSEEPAV